MLATITLSNCVGRFKITKDLTFLLQGEIYQDLIYLTFPEIEDLLYYCKEIFDYPGTICMFTNHANYEEFKAKYNLKYKVTTI